MHNKHQTTLSKEKATPKGAVKTTESSTITTASLLSDLILPSLPLPIHSLAINRKTSTQPQILRLVCFSHFFMSMCLISEFSKCLYESYTVYIFKISLCSPSYPLSPLNA